MRVTLSRDRERATEGERAESVAVAPDQSDAVYTRRGRGETDAATKGEGQGSIRMRKARGTGPPISRLFAKIWYGALDRRCVRSEIFDTWRSSGISTIIGANRGEGNRRGGNARRQLPASLAR